MAEPKKRLTSARSGGRKSHDALKKVSLNVCQNCKNTKKPHLVCSVCGFYNGKKVIKLSKDVEVESKQKEQLKDE